MNGQIVYARQAISPMVFAAEAMGDESEIKVAGFKGKLSLPILNPHGGKGFHSVLAPLDYDAGVLKWLHEKEPVYWGKQLLLPSGETAVANYLLQFRLAKTKKLAQMQTDAIERELESWFSCVRDWTEVLTYQDLSIAEPLGNSPDSGGNYYWSWKSKKKWGMFTTSHFRVTIVAPDPKKSLTLEKWHKAIERANRGVRPPDEHLLLRDALARHRRGQYNYSVIFAGVAAELTLKKKLEDVLSKHKKSRKLIDNILNNPLGKIFDISEALHVALPKDSRFINTARNKAVHKHERINKADAGTALSVATELINKQSPL